MTERRAVLSGSTFEEQIGYARAVVDGDWVQVPGATGFDCTTMTISDDVVEQAEQCVGCLMWNSASELGLAARAAEMISPVAGAIVAPHLAFTVGVVPIA
ncbi:RidA family protein [Plantactinospora endophytica]|uniref:Uncharacterized protein n=1 Tax=Plantactinospora endophytica TaxID=673535 RepID=A0ABQ4DZ56_9ACTN|nr:hypothetical protein [Plantactinospora endophytica]GIG87720.1 hypothetical protein Pen02_26560 [Plantactinospora endophytica]